MIRTMENKGFIDLNQTMEYKGYTGSIEYSEQDGLYFGQVQGIRSLISYEGVDVSELKKDFCDAIEDYLDLCDEYEMEVEHPVVLQKVS